MISHSNVEYFRTPWFSHHDLLASMEFLRMSNHTNHLLLKNLINLEYYVWILPIIFHTGEFFYPHLLLLKNLIPIWYIMSEIYHFFQIGFSLKKGEFFYPCLFLLKNFIPIWNIVSEIYKFFKLDFLENQTSHSKWELFLNGHED